MPKLRKSFTDYEELSAATSAVEELLEYYKPDSTLADILSNVRDNESKWEECEACKGSGMVRRTDYRGTKLKALDPFVTSLHRLYAECPVCKGKCHVKAKKEK